MIQNSDYFFPFSNHFFLLVIINRKILKRKLLLFQVSYFIDQALNPGFAFQDPRLVPSFTITLNAI